MSVTCGGRLCAQRLAATCAACVQDFAAGFGCHARTEAVAALANQVARLVCAFHRVGSSLLAQTRGADSKAGMFEARPLGGDCAPVN